MKIACAASLALLLIFGQRAHAEDTGVINDPGADLNLRAEQSANAPVIATVKAGEPFSFQCEAPHHRPVRDRLRFKKCGELRVAQEMINSGGNAGMAFRGGAINILRDGEESFARVEMPLSEVPGRESDTEVAGAVLGHQYTEPVRWAKPNVLILERHEYFQKLKPSSLEGIKFDAVHSFDRLYQLTATIKPDGKATVVWKLQDR